MAFVLLTGCGGSGGGEAPVGGGGAGSGGSGSGSGWVSGQFFAASTFKNQCQNPRSGTDPSTGRLYPDIQGATLDENNWLRSWSDETYLWYDEIIDRNPANDAVPIDYFDQLKTFEMTATGASKDKFHFTYDTEDWIALSQSGVRVGYGVVWAILEALPPREIAVAYSEPNTPAGTGGFERGDRIVSIDGIDVVDDDSAAGVAAINAALYPAQAGETHNFEIEDLVTGNIELVQLTSGSVASTPVQHTRTVTSPNGATVGYMLFNDHIATSEQGLIDAIDVLAAVPGGIDDLVIDIRYNGGGFLVIASQLAYMIAGQASTGGRVFELTEFNDKHSAINPVTGNPITSMGFVDETVGLSAPANPPTPLPTLDLSRVFVLTGNGTCSASEAVVNGLRGIGIEVIQIGETTCGKPYGFYPTDNCGSTFFTVQFRGVNDSGFGDYTDGFTPSGSSSSTDASPPGCLVADDFDHRFGDPAEARLSAALFYRDNSICPAPAPSPKVQGLSKASTEGASQPIVWKPEGLNNRIIGH